MWMLSQQSRAEAKSTPDASVVPPSALPAWAQQLRLRSVSSAADETLRFQFARCMKWPSRRFCLQSDLTQDISTSVLWVNSKPHMITLDYTIQVPNAARQNLPEVR